MAGVVFVKTYTAAELPPVNETEVWRYAFYARSEPKPSELSVLLDGAVSEALPLLTYRLCFRCFALDWFGGAPRLPFRAQSGDLASCLDGSEELVMFAATLGLELDRLIERSQRLSPARALLLQALGAERIEALCDLFCSETEAEARSKGLEITPRFSPGYGDLSLEVQRDFFRLLDCGKIGLALNSSLLMSPSKSVTALFGLRPARETAAREREKCERCLKTDCGLRGDKEEAAAQSV
ncbi:MAG: Vitamin B12 dependent methionine synthase activation subunit [Oscillospiraceae bacterium]|nr:Vitamin B12 dependent methionine synthase activation subunit [Oscillospiraceae bacterium]